MRRLQKLLIKFGCGAFGSFVLLAIRGIPPLPGIGPEAGHIWVGLGFTVSGGIITLIWQVGDEQPIRSFIFGLTWPPLIAALTR
jgi:hypothetical protein